MSSVKVYRLLINSKHVSSLISNTDIDRAFPSKILVFIVQEFMILEFFCHGELRSITPLTDLAHKLN